MALRAFNCARCAGGSYFGDGLFGLRDDDLPRRHKCGPAYLLPVAHIWNFGNAWWLLPAAAGAPWSSFRLSRAANERTRMHTEGGGISISSLRETTDSGVRYVLDDHPSMHHVRGRRTWHTTPLSLICIRFDRQSTVFGFDVAPQRSAAEAELLPRFGAVPGRDLTCTSVDASYIVDDARPTTVS